MYVWAAGWADLWVCVPLPVSLRCGGSWWLSRKSAWPAFLLCQTVINVFKTCRVNGKVHSAPLQALAHCRGQGSRKDHPTSYCKQKSPSRPPTFRRWATSKGKDPDKIIPDRLATLLFLVERELNWWLEMGCLPAHCADTGGA